MPPGTDDMALAMQSVPALGRAESELVRCFRTGAGLPAGLLDDWGSLREEALARRQRASLVDDILPRVPGLVPRLRAGIDVLDVGAGRPPGAGVVAAGVSRQPPRHVGSCRAGRRPRFRPGDRLRRSSRTGPAGRVAGGGVRRAAAGWGVDVPGDRGRQRSRRQCGTPPGTAALHGLDVPAGGRCGGKSRSAG